MLASIARRRVWRAPSPGALLAGFRDRNLLADASRTPEHVPDRASVYCGFDATADSLHLGNLVQLLALARVRHAGWSAHALIGGATTLIGDPSGRSSERPLLDTGEIDANQAALTQQVTRVLHAAGGDAPLHVVNNRDWIAPMTVIDLLRGPGRHFRISGMLGKESVRARIASDAGISFTEFSYQIFQALDFAHLAQHQGCVAQLGGADQWGNITAGIDLVRRSLARHDVFGFTLPLLVTENGEKFGKSAGNAIWLDEAKTPAYAMYQYLINSSDADVPRLLAALTMLPNEELQHLLACHDASPHTRRAQRALADSVVALLHGDAALRSCQRASDVLFAGTRVTMASADPATVSALLIALHDVPGASMPVSALHHTCVLDLLVHVRAAASRAAARRAIEAGGVYVNNERVTDPDACLDASQHVLDQRLCLLRLGKKRHVPIRVQ